MDKKTQRFLLIGIVLVFAFVFFKEVYLAKNENKQELTVLMYHDFIESGTPSSDWVLTTDALRADLQYFADNGYVTVLPRELAAGKLDDGSELPEKMVMLTFDDGYASNCTLALPILQEFNAKAVVGLITSRIGEVDGFLNWEQCREMAKSGLIEFGSHTHDHHIRPEVSGIARMEGETQESYTARIGNDLRESVELIASEIGTPVTYFAHPLGKTDEWATDILSELFSVTVTSNMAKADLSKGLYLLPRFNVTEQQRAESFINR